MRSSSFLLVVAAILGAGPTAAQDPDYSQFVEVGRRIDAISELADSGFAIADVDGDGLEDAVFLGRTNSSHVLFTLGAAADGVLDIKQALSVPREEFYARVVPGTIAGQVQILTIGSGKARRYAGWPLEWQGDILITPDARWAEIADSDGDGKDDLVVLTDQQILRYDLESGALSGGRTISGYRNFSFAQLDADAASEIILGGPGPGVVLDGATFASDWEYIDSFGDWVAPGRFITPDRMHWFGVTYDARYTLFRSLPWSPLWTEQAWGQIRAASSPDVEGAGLDSLLLVGSSHVLVINPRTQLPPRVISVAASPSNAVGADLDGSGADEIVISSYFNSGSPLMTIADGLSGAARWQFVTPEGPFKATALGDIDGDGRIELVAAAQNSTFGTVAAFDALTGREKWRSTRDGTAVPFGIAAEYLALLPRNGAPGMDLVMAGQGALMGQIAVIDGPTRLPKLLIGYDWSTQSPLYKRRVKYVTALDYDGDGVLDYAAAVEGASSATAGARIIVFSGVDGDPIWVSPILGDGSTRVQGLFALDGEGNEGELVITLADGFRAFNRSTGLLAWTLAVDMLGASFVPQGMTGPELLTFSDDGQVSFFDRESRLLLRSFTLPHPRAVTALDGNVRTIIVAGGGSLVLMDGTDGTQLATTGHFDDMESEMKPISVMRQSTSSWMVSTASDTMMTRFRLLLTDQMFGSGFE